MKILLSYCFVLLYFNSYSQNNRILDSLITKYSLDADLVQSWQNDIYSCRDFSNIDSIDTLFKIKQLTTSDFFSLFGLPDKFTNAYGDVKNIGDTTICTYNIYGNCKDFKNKSLAEEIIVIFIDRIFYDADRMIID